jgi:1,4-dihydroxy-2-naphthoate octaprenyltransferase
MKKIVALIIVSAFLISCQEETRNKVKDAGKAVGSEIKVAAKKTQEKVGKVIDTAKVKEKMKTAVAKSAEAVEKGAKKLKEKASEKK